eukprot:3466339-Prymnesium_polylepis.6
MGADAPSGQYAPGVQPVAKGSGNKSLDATKAKPTAMVRVRAGYASSSSLDTPADICHLSTPCT